MPPFFCLDHRAVSCCSSNAGQHFLLPFPVFPLSKAVFLGSQRPAPPAQCAHFPHWSRCMRTFPSFVTILSLAASVLLASCGGGDNTAEIAGESGTAATRQLLNVSYDPTRE